MKQTHRKPLEDRTKKRREYVARQRRETILATFGALLVVSAIPVAFVVASFFSHTFASGFIVILASMATLVICLAVGLFGWRFCCARCSIANAVPYVPPVSEQIATLP